MLCMMLCSEAVLVVCFDEEWSCASMESSKKKVTWLNVACDWGRKQMRKTPPLPSINYYKKKE